MAFHQPRLTAPFAELQVEDATLHATTALNNAVGLPVAGRGIQGWYHRSANRFQVVNSGGTNFFRYSSTNGSTSYLNEMAYWPDPAGERSSGRFALQISDVVGGNVYTGGLLLSPVTGLGLAFVARPAVGVMSLHEFQTSVGGFATVSKTLNSVSGITGIADTDWVVIDALHEGATSYLHLQWYSNTGTGTSSRPDYGAGPRATVEGRSRYVTPGYAFVSTTLGGGATKNWRRMIVYSASPVAADSYGIRSRARKDFVLTGTAMDTHPPELAQAAGPSDLSFGAVQNLSPTSCLVEITCGDDGYGVNTIVDNAAGPRQGATFSLFTNPTGELQQNRILLMNRDGTIRRMEADGSNIATPDVLTGPSFEAGANSILYDMILTEDGQHAILCWPGIREGGVNLLGRFRRYAWDNANDTFVQPAVHDLEFDASALGYTNPRTVFEVTTAVATAAGLPEHAGRLLCGTYGGGTILEIDPDDFTLIREFWDLSLLGQPAIVRGLDWWFDPASGEPWLLVPNWTDEPDGASAGIYLVKYSDPTVYRRFDTGAASDDLAHLSDVCADSYGGYVYVAKWAQDSLGWGPSRVLRFDYETGAYVDSIFDELTLLAQGIPWKSPFGMGMMPTRELWAPSETLAYVAGAVGPDQTFLGNLRAGTFDLTVIPCQRLPVSLQEPNPRLLVPSARRVVQIGSNGSADLPVSGTYDTGEEATVPAAIEASWNGGEWQTIDASPAAGVFAGVLAGQPPGQGTLTVRFTNDFLQTSERGGVGVGDVFVIAGGIEASGRAPDLQSVSDPSLEASVFNNNNFWGLLDGAFPLDSPSGQRDSVSTDASAAGSAWLPLATAILATLEYPVAFVPCAKGGSTLLQWLPGADHQDRTTLYGSMVYRALQTGCRAVLFIPEQEGSVVQATYRTRLGTLAAAIWTDLGVPLVLAKPPASDAALDADETKIRAAIADAWATEEHVIAGPDLGDLDTAAGALTANGDLDTSAARWWEALWNGIYTAATTFTYTVYQADGTTPLQGATVTVSADEEGEGLSAAQVTDSLGRVEFTLGPGTFYFWPGHPLWAFDTPDAHVVSDLARSASVTSTGAVVPAPQTARVTRSRLGRL